MKVYFRWYRVATLVKQQTPSIMSFFHVQTLPLLTLIIVRNNQFLKKSFTIGLDVTYKTSPKKT